MRVARWLILRGKADPLERIVERYEAEAPSGLSRYWSKLGPGRSPSVLAALVKADLHRRFQAGERPKILDYLREFPVLAEDDDRVVSLVYEEFCLLEEHGERPDSHAFCAAYGRWRDSLESQLIYHRELSRAVNAESPAINFPEPGELFGKYRLASLLGVGAVARVYLATEEELADREVAIKVSASFGQEPSILAKLDHRNIVPIFTVATAESGLRGICMPYRPGVTLEELIRRIGRGKPPRYARAIGDALRPPGAQPAFPPEQQAEGWFEFPIHRTFPEAVAWIGLALANALSYLHQRGVFHRDVKPANILLALREGPQLLDFNLAQVPSDAKGASAAQKGGTLPYMAPEQLKAFLDPSAWDDVGASADLYSLGLVLRELLTGRRPEPPTSQGSLAREIQSLLDRRLAPTASIGEINPAVPPALESIVDTCLAVRPEDRYATADELAADLRRFLERKPLAVAPNTSRLELGVNWIYRNRKTLASAIVLAVVVAATIAFFPRGALIDWRFRVAERHLESGRPEELKLARDEFESLYQDFPDTAKSSIGLALTLLRQGSRDNTRINKLFDKAAMAGDAELVIQDELGRMPRSEVLHRALGLALSNHGQYKLARESLERSIEIKPGEYQSYVYLARIDQSEGRFPEAVGHLERALQFCRKPPAVHEYRKSVLDLLVDLIDDQLKVDRGDAEAQRRRFESHLGSFKDERRTLAAQGKPPGDEHVLAYFQGCLASVCGALEVDPARANRLFDEADRLFDRAEALVSEGKAGVALPIKDRRAELSSRRSAKPPPAGLAR